ncbi:MAG: PAS domain S-box protein [Steroidobacteraceae bacterium]
MIVDSSANRGDRAPSGRDWIVWLGVALITAAVILLRFAIEPVLYGQAPFLILLIAPVLAAAWGGFAPGAVATAVCFVAGEVLFINADGSMLPANGAEWIRAGFFVSEGLLFSWLFEERRRATATARQREHRFRDAIEAAPTGMLLTGQDGRIVFANAAARRGFGYSAEEFRRLTIEDLVPPALRDSHRRDRTEFSRAPQPREMGAGRELRARRQDGSDFPVEIGLGPMPTEGEHLVLAAVVDVTERHRTHARLVDAERRQRFLLKLTEKLQSLATPEEMMSAATQALGEHLGVAQLGYGEVDAAQQFVIIERDWNDGRIPSVVGRHRMNDYGPQFILDMKAGRTAAIPDITLDPRTNAPEVQKAYEAIHTRAILNAPLIRHGRMVAMIFTHHPEPRPWSPEDISLAEETCARIWTAVERVRAERAARISLELLDRAGAAARVGAFVDTLEGPGSLRWSDRMFEIMGVPPGPTPDREQAFERFPPAVRTILREAMARMLEGGEPIEIELPLLQRGSSASWVRIYVAPTMKDGRCVELSGAMQDISDRKQLELEVVRATNQERERIGEDLHDDLGQVLTAATLQVGAFRRTLGRATSPEEQRAEIEAIERNLEHARTVCRSLARRYVAPVSASSFLAMLRQLGRDLADGRDCTVRGDELPPGTPPTTAQELYRIAQEALSNALRHSQCRKLRLQLQVDAERLVLAIEDDGIGLKPQPAETGVGLTSMRSRAARIGGIITLGAGPLGGTRVTVTCARAEAATPA